jgi:hypothetical protein
MKKIYTFVLALSFVGIAYINNVQAQAEVTTAICTKYIVSPFISDGQQYKALLNGEEIAEFHATFYGGSTYRIVGATGQSEGNLVFSLYDKERNLLFTNRDYENSPYWDFKFTSTIDCIIEAGLDSGNQTASGFAFLLIGFKQ